MAWDALAGQLLAPKRLRSAQVETSTRCNYRCPYCQITHSARPRRLMSLEEFRTIIEQLAELPAVRKFYLNGYNEPSLVPEIVEQIQLAARLDAELIILTNGTGLTDRKCEAMARAHPRLTLDIHLSAVDASEYRQAHGVILNPELLPRLRGLARRTDLTNIEFRMMVMGRGDDRHRQNWRGVRDFFADTRMTVGMDVVHDRAGALPSPYQQGFRHADVFGCALDNRPFDWVHVTAGGNWVLCCQDYNEDYVFGNLFKQSIRDIAESERRRTIVMRGFGRDSAHPSGICTRCRYAVVEPATESRVA